LRWTTAAAWAIRAGRSATGWPATCTFCRSTAAAIQNLLYCIKRCDLELAGIASSAYVSAISPLVEDEQELGAACIDLGGGATGISIFMKKHMIFADAVRMGGDHVTSDISKGLQIRWHRPSGSRPAMAGFSPPAWTTAR
jgi:cell division protein FtsA